MKKHHLVSTLVTKAHETIPLTHNALFAQQAMVKILRAEKMETKVTTARLARNTAFSKHPTEPLVRASFNAIMVSKRYTIAVPDCISVLIVEFALIAL